MLSTSFLVALSAAFLAGCVSGLTGFGIALISVPLLLFVYDPATVVALTAVLSVSINLAVVRDSWGDARKRLVLALLVPALVGMAAGVEVLRTVDPVYLRLGAGVMVVFSTLLLLREVRLPGAGTRWGPVAAGSTSGVLATSIGLSGPPIVLLFASRGLAKHAFRSSSALYFLVVSVAALPLLVFRDVFNWAQAPLALALVPAALLGKLAGTALVERISEKTFNLASLRIVLLTGALGVATALHALLF
jgi:uncharacterized membrane protein YfcA